MSAFDPTLVDAAQRSAAWPFEEARKLVARIEKSGKKEVLFETGYGPSGLPHIGTFGEVARTSMVRHAFRVLTDDTVPTRLIAFSDDLDGLRKVPDNVPNKELLAKHLGRPLTEVPDPFGTHDSFGRHNNARLRAFLDQFGFDYEFKSSTDSYRAGEFDATLLKLLARYDAVMKIMLPTLREERAATYSPFLPIHPRTRIVMQVPIEARDVEKGTITWTDPESGERFETPITGGHAKLQWKPDWAMRWVALGIDYEMAGKDLIDSVKVSSAIARALDATPPDGFNYELFLDEQGQKISKSKGNGLTIEQWLSYGSQESLALFMYSRPREAKKLHFDVIPRAADEYLQFLGGYERQDWKNRLGNPVWHIHNGNPPAPEVIASGEGDNAAKTQVTFGLLMNLVAVANAEDKDVLWGFLRRYAPGASPATHPRLDALVGYAIRYFQDFVKPAKQYRPATLEERQALQDLSARLGELSAAGVTDAGTIQDAVYDIGRRDPYKTVQKDGSAGVSLAWFNTLYEILLGEPKGPRFGSFAAIYGIENTRALIAKALAGDLLAEHHAFLKAREAARG
ncbi:lysine--tRNA ligase [Bosea sp. 2YAB26]|uniref:lysine--tRNA ligase n=1 Tax=Bosea sp. 2YAB26 TaxID=3237478 RepID=UPI003F8DB4AA